MLIKPLLPLTAPSQAAPFDNLTAFAFAQTLTASGYVNNLNTQLTYGPGRHQGVLRLDVSAVNMATGDEFYRFYLLGSNDAAFGNGNVELLASYDFAAAAALRQLANICAASPAVADTGLNATTIVRPFSNQVDQYVFEYLQLYFAVGGTAPSVTCSAWLAPWSGQKM